MRTPAARCLVGIQSQSQPSVQNRCMQAQYSDNDRPCCQLIHMAYLSVPPTCKCCGITGTGAYVLFTLERLIAKLVKQLQLLVQVPTKACIAHRIHGHFLRNATVHLC